MKRTMYLFLLAMATALIAATPLAAMTAIPMTPPDQVQVQADVASRGAPTQAGFMGVAYSTTGQIALTRVQGADKQAFTAAPPIVDGAILTTKTEVSVAKIDQTEGSEQTAPAVQARTDAATQAIDTEAAKMIAKTEDGAEQATRAVQAIDVATTKTMISVSTSSAMVGRVQILS